MPIGFITPSLLTHLLILSDQRFAPGDAGHRIPARIAAIGALSAIVLVQAGAGGR